MIVQASNISKYTLLFLDMYIIISIWQPHIACHLLLWIELWMGSHTNCKKTNYISKFLFCLCWPWLLYVGRSVSWSPCHHPFVTMLSLSRLTNYKWVTLYGSNFSIWYSGISCVRWSVHPPSTHHRHIHSHCEVRSLI